MQGPQNSISVQASLDTCQPLENITPLAQHHNRDSSVVKRQQVQPFQTCTHHASRTVVLGGRLHQAAKLQKPTVKSRQCGESISITVHCQLDKKNPLATFARQEVPNTKFSTYVRRPTGTIMQQEFIQCSWTTDLETSKEAQRSKDNRLDMSPQFSSTKQSTRYVWNFPLTT